MRFTNLDEVIACNEAVRERDEVSQTADDDDLELVARALERALGVEDPIEAAAAGFYEGNKRTAVVITRWFISLNTDVTPPSSRTGAAQLPQPLGLGVATSVRGLRGP